MENVISTEQLYNENYIRNHADIEFKELIKEGIINKLLDEDQTNAIVNSFKNSLFNFVMQRYDSDDYFDESSEIKEESTKIMDAINDYLKTFNTPFAAFSYIIKTDDIAIIEYSLDRYEKLRTHVSNNIELLNEKSKKIISLNFEFKEFMKSLTERLNYNVPIYSYPLMNGSIYNNISSLDELDDVVNKLLIETAIIYKFKEEEIIELLKSFSFEDISKNIASSALYNYFFNAFYKDEVSIRISLNQDSIVKHDIKIGLFSEEDIFEIINDGKIEFTESEKEYIVKNFIPMFKYEIVEKKLIDRVVRKK